ncbi:MAG: hypothetical protein V4598_04870 [Bdellovibrionota bacterium]
MKVLIVERDIPLLETMKQICDEENLTPILAASLDQAKKLLSQGYLPDLIICDEFVPQLQGEVWMKEMSDHKDWKKIPFVLMRSRRNKDKSVPAMELMKPFSINDVLELFVKVRLSSQTPT